MNKMSSIPHGLSSTPEDLTNLGPNPPNFVEVEKDTLLHSFCDRSSQTENYLHGNQEYKPRSQPRQGDRRSSMPNISRDDVSLERAKHLERNRIAASKCRFKKKQEHRQIQSVLNGESAKRDTLLAEVNVLKEEVWFLKNQVFEHATICDYQQISLQLELMAQNKVLGDGADAISPSTFSVSAWPNGSAGGGYSGGVEPCALRIAADHAHEDFPDGLIDSFIYVPLL